MMRWKILELTGRYSVLDEILAELKTHPEFAMEEEAALSILTLYKDMLSEDLRKEVEERAAN